MPYHTSEEHTSELQSHDNLYAVSLDRKSTRLNSSHTIISYAVFCLKKKDTAAPRRPPPQCRTAGSPPTRAARSRHGVRAVLHRLAPLVLDDCPLRVYRFFFNETAPPEISALPQHQALPI